MGWRWEMQRQNDGDMEHTEQSRVAYRVRVPELEWGLKGVEKTKDW